jgi:hypothetical protein
MRAVARASLLWSARIINSLASGWLATVMKDLMNEVLAAALILGRRKGNEAVERPTIASRSDELIAVDIFFEMGQ